MLSSGRLRPYLPIQSGIETPRLLTCLQCVALNVDKALQLDVSIPSSKGPAILQGRQAGSLWHDWSNVMTRPRPLHMFSAQ
jgi:hypothetical protein